MFNNFKDMVNKQIDRMITLSSELFYVDIDRDELFKIYLNSFPEGTDKMFRERTVHDCQGCKKFLRKVGNMVAIIDGQIETIWDINIDNFYQDVADKLSERLHFGSIAGIYRNQFDLLGEKVSRDVQEDGIINIFEHFEYILPARFVEKDIAYFNGNSQTNKDLLKRSLNDITIDALEEIIELITQNLIYRGQEHLEKVKMFYEVKMYFDSFHGKYNDMFIWEKSAEIKENGRFRNTVIGTLLCDISSGIPIESAVKMFEDKVAPSNYKRSSALITQKMIDKAQEAIVEMGFEKSLARRHISLKDLTTNNVLWLNKEKKKDKKEKKEKKEKKGVLASIKPDNLLTAKKKVGIDEFIKNILPLCENVEVMIRNSQINNFMSVIGPENNRSKNMMKWNNPFSWSYNGEVTDSIKEKVKNAGGKIDAFFRVSLEWFNTDDLDIHCIEPNGNHIYYANKKSFTGGVLDVDMNVCDPLTNEAVENIVFNDNMLEGKYRFYVNNYRKREFVDVGFKAEMELDGKIYTFSHDKDVRDGTIVNIIEFEYSKLNGIKTLNSLDESISVKEVWNVETNKWTKVNMIMNSPNFWNGENTGNKHWFFILDKCLNPQKARGFYNEFLMKDLHIHRKVFEVLSSQMKVEFSEKQLSGLGFSFTQTNSLLCRVSGKFDKIFEIVFAPTRVPELVELDEIDFCEICKNTVYNVDSRVPCPHCSSIFHTSHFLESVRVSGKCTICKKSVGTAEINKLVQLITV